MATRVDYEARFAAALREIANYMTPAQHRRESERRYGLSAEESMEMAIENMLGTAKQALRGYRPRKPLAAAPVASPSGRLRDLVSLYRAAAAQGPAIVPPVPGYLRFDDAADAIEEAITKVASPSPP